MGQALTLLPIQPASTPLSIRIFTCRSQETAQQQMEKLTQMLKVQSYPHVRISYLHCEHITHLNQWKLILGIRLPENNLRQDLILRKKQRRFYVEEELKAIMAVLSIMVVACKQQLCGHSDVISLIFMEDDQLTYCRPSILMEDCRVESCRRDQVQEQRMRERTTELLFELILLEKIVQPGQSQLNRVDYLYRSKWLSQTLRQLLICPQNKIWSWLLIACPKQPKHIFNDKESQSRKFPSKNCKFRRRAQKPNETIIFTSGLLNDLKQQFVESIMGEDSSQQGLGSPIHRDSAQGVSRMDWITAQQEEIVEEEGAKEQVSMLSHWQEPIPEDEGENEDNEDTNWGIVHFQEGSRYQGCTKAGVKEGQGKFYFSDGGYYHGQWRSDQMDGFGQLYYASGKLAYRGSWKEGKFHGRGLILNEYPQPIENEFDYRDFGQVGLHWQSYEGTFCEDDKHGQGLLLLSNGQSFTGRWEQNEVQGRGEFRGKGGVVKGLWIDNQLFQIDEEPIEESDILEMSKIQHSNE